jgi:DNA (cytosine-5)-methyltransferase 1
MLYGPTHLDLFSGIGGFSIAAESVGFRTIGFSEIDVYACRILQKSWPHIPNFGDVRNITRDTVKDVTLITGGFPCQPFSVAGKKLGDSDERHLWPELVRILGEIRPRFALFENVPNLLSISGGRIFNGILSDLCKIGYDCIWNLVPASAVGANHQRDRLWIVAHATDSKWRTGQFIEQKEAVRSHWDNESFRGSWWTVEPNVGRVAHGIPNRMDRLRCLGNAIVPQVAQIFLKEIYNQLEVN